MKRMQRVLQTDFDIRESLEKHIRSCVVKHPKRVRKDLAPSVKGGYRA